MKRSCGTRKENGLYACTGVRSFGKEIEYFCIDPTKPVDLKPFRTPILIERKDSDICDMAVYIGKQYYPFISDFLEETRVMGISRRIPKNFPIEKLAANESRMLFIHERAVPLFDYDTYRDCPRKIKHSKKPGDTCVFDLWHLSSLESIEKKHEVHIIDDIHASIQTPSTKYGINIPRMPVINPEQKKGYKYQMGIFASFWLDHLEFVNKDKRLPEGLKNKVKNTELDIMVVEE